MWREPLKWDREARKAGEHRRVFCASLADVFEDREDLDEPRFRMLRTIASTDYLDWLLLTKRPQSIEPILRRIPSPLPGFSAWDDWCYEISDKVWLGTSVEDQQRADERLPELFEVPAAVRFLSVEPLLGPIDISWWLGTGGFHWVIVGGESGHGARPCDLSWIRSIRDQCRSAGTPLFIKQMGSNPIADFADATVNFRDSKGGDIDEWPEDLKIREFPR
jgi:protein gp37